MIHAFRWLPEQNSGEWLHGQPALDWIAQEACHSDLPCWIDLDQPTPAEEEHIFSQLVKPHPLTLEDLTRPRRLPNEAVHFPKVEEFDDHLLVIVNPIRSEILGDASGFRRAVRERKLHSQLSALLTHRILITHHCTALPVMDSVKNYLPRHPLVIERGPDYIFHLVLDSLVDEYAPVVDRLEDRLDALEFKMFQDSRPDFIRRLLRLKRFIVDLKKTLVLEREVIMRLSRGEFKLVDEKEMVYYRNVYDHLVRYSELIESGRELIFDLIQTHLAAVSNRMNAIMKVLAMVSTMILPMTLVAGIYGMNFENTPEFHWKFGFHYAVGLMAVLATAALGLFRWKGWL